MLFVQLPITIYLAINQRTAYISASEINTLANSLYEEKKVPIKARIFSVNEADTIKFSNLQLADIDWTKDPKEAQKAQFSFKIFDARKVGYTDSEILDYLVKEWNVDVSKAKASGIVSDTGKVCLQVRYGTRVLELAKGKNSIEVGTAAELLTVLSTVKSAVEAGDLDAQIYAASAAVRERFAQ